jgi:hypothetical protein
MATPKNLVRAGSFLPTLFSDCIQAVKRCHNGSVFAPKARTPTAPLHPVISADPFCKWGIYFMECKPMSADGYKSIVVAVDYKRT